MHRNASFGLPRSVYVHVPFCAHRCGYCDFTLVAGRADLVPRYLAAMQSELATVGEPCEVETTFLGGGTPTQLAPGELAQLVGWLRNRFPPAASHEFTVEANPADVTEAMAERLAELGVNRVSLGAQSFDPDVLRLLERDHAATTIATAVDRLHAVGIGNISLDLIFGVPGQSLDLWRRTLEAAFALEPTHLSTYGLTFEKGTTFWTRRSRGELMAADDGLERAMYEAAMEATAVHGFEHYEISSFARPGHRCRHNEVYWTGRPFHAFGPGAARYLDGVRETNHRSVTTWLKRIESGESGIAEREQLDPEDHARERLVLGLRRIAGIDESTFAAETGFPPHDLAGSAIEAFVTDGLLERRDGRLRLTTRGRFFADSVVSELL